MVFVFGGRRCLGLRKAGPSGLRGGRRWKNYLYADGKGASSPTMNTMEKPCATSPKRTGGRFRMASAMLLLLVLSAAVPAQDFLCLTNGGSITITGYLGPGGDVTIPDTMDGLPVTSVGDLAFYKCSSLTSVTISTNLTSIGELAFYKCSNLATVTVGRGVTSIGDYAFLSCVNLTGIYFLGNLPSVGAGVFADDDEATVYHLATLASGETLGGRPTAVWTQVGREGDFSYSWDGTDMVITSYHGWTYWEDVVEIPSTITGLPVTSIGTNAFANSHSLISISLPDSVMNIGNSAFWSCSGLSNVITSANLANIGVSAFADCPSLTDFSVPGSVTNIGDGAFAYCTSLASIILPESLTSISDHMFHYCTNLTNVTIPSSLTSIGIAAFFECNSVGSLTVPDSVTNIGMGAFISCTSLSNITLPNSLLNIMGGTFEDCLSLTSIRIPDTVTSIGYFAFYWCSNLRSINIPYCVTNIGQQAFNKCGSLINITIPGNVTSIGSGAFYECESLTNATISSGVMNIGPAAFADCASLTTITIPSSVTNLDVFAFGWCPVLTSVLFAGNAPSLGSNVFKATDNATIYYLPGTTNWGETFGERPTALWPQMQTTDGAFGIGTNGFGFNFLAGTNAVIVTEACTNLASPVWLPMSTNTLTNGSAYFCDPGWTNQPGRFYRLRSP